MIVPLFVGREKSVRALEEVMQDDKQILLSSQIDPTVDDPHGRRHLPRRRAGQRAATAEAARRHREGAGRGQGAACGSPNFVENPVFFEATRRASGRSPRATRPRSRRWSAPSAEEFERYAKIKKNIPEEALAAVSRHPRTGAAGRPGRRAIWASTSARSRSFWKRWTSPSGWRRSTARCRAKCRSCRSRRRSRPA